MGHNLQVHIKTDSDIKPKCFPGICLHVKETISAAIKHVFELLNLAGIEVSLAFVCPCLGVPHSHTAFVYLFQPSQWRLRCSVTQNSAGAAQNEHRVWLEAPVVEQGKPSLPKLLGLKIPRKVGAEFMQFGVLLLDDEDGTQVDALEDECNGKCERIVCKILEEWVRGRAGPCLGKRYRTHCENALFVHLRTILTPPTHKMTDRNFNSVLYTPALFFNVLH